MESSCVMEKKRKIGIMGGTFDPIHIAHLILGEKTYEEFGLEKVYFMPSGNPPHKRHREGRASDDQRVAMVRAAIADNPHFELSLMEMERDGFTYSYQTLKTLYEQHPDTEYYFVIGADSLFSFDTWMKPEEICKYCKLVVAVRDHASIEQIDEKICELTELFHGSFLKLHTENMDVSSNMIRDWAGKGKSLKYYLPDSVIRIIEKNQIYQSVREDEMNHGEV